MDGLRGQDGPDRSPVQMAVASWLLEQGRGDEAQSHVEAAAKLDPKSNEVAAVARARGPPAQGLRASPSRSSRPWPTSRPATPGCATSWPWSWPSRPTTPKRQRALELAELSVRQNPKALDALATLGTVYYRLKRLDDAEKVLQAVVASGKGNSDAAYILALVKADRGQPDSAPALLKTALAAPGLFIFRKDAQQWLDRLTTKSSK